MAQLPQHLNPITRTVPKSPSVAAAIAIGELAPERDPAVLAMEQSLNQAKDRMESVYRQNEKQANFIRSAMDFYGSRFKARLQTEYGIQYGSNAWLKCWELLHIFALPKLRGEAKPPSFNSLHIAEFPGSFILATQHFREALPKLLGRPISGSWQASSYYNRADQGEFFKDEYGLWAEDQGRQTPHWLMDGVDQIGDVRLRKTIEYHVARVPADLFLVTSDLALDADQYNRLEAVNVHAHFGAFVLAISCLQKTRTTVASGMMFLKFFSFLTPFNIDLLQFATTIFDGVQVCKPFTSRPLNSETYLVGVGFRGIAETQLKQLMGIIDLAEADPKFAANLWQMRLLEATTASTASLTALDVMKPFYRDQLQHLEYFMKCADRKTSEDAIAQLRVMARAANDSWLRRYADGL